MSDMNTICYLNTDLDLVSPDDLVELTSALESRGVFSLSPTLGNDGLMYITFETLASYIEPEANINAMVTAIESSLMDGTAPHNEAWWRCTKHEFNIGYDCGDEPWAFQQGLSVGLLSRMSALGISLRWTLYPPAGQVEPC